MLMLSKISEDCSSADVPTFKKYEQDGLDVERPDVIRGRKIEKLIQDLVNKEPPK